MNKQAHFPSVRLAAAGIISVLLLAWLAFVPRASPFQADVNAKTYPVALLGTSLLSLANLTVLAPVLWHGPGRDRWLAMLVSVFPLLTFGVTLLWFAGRISLWVASGK
jgi:hypothetical protein